MFRYLIPALFALAACQAPPPSGGGSGTPPVNPAPVTFSGSYTLVALNGRPVGGPITLDFEPGSRLSGSAPCNRYFGPYSAASDSSFGTQIGATRRACPQLQLEGEYFEALGRAVQFQAGPNAERLGLFDAAGREVASYARSGAPIPPPSGGQVDILGGWTIAAVRVNGGLTPASGTSITFNPGRDFTANLGCNSAGGPYTLNGDQLDFGAIAVTTRACIAPAPFEGPILDALNRIQTAVQRGPGTVDLLDPAGQPLLALRR